MITAIQSGWKCQRLRQCSDWQREANREQDPQRLLPAYLRPVNTMLDMDGHNSTLSHKIILIRTHPERWNNYSPVNVMPGANMLISVIYSFLLREVTNKTSGGKKRNGRETNEKERSEDDRRAYTLVWMNTCRP